MYKKLALSCALLIVGSTIDISAAVPCGTGTSLNVGILQFNVPYSDYDLVDNVPYGFDVDLSLAIARTLGLSVNFIFFTGAAAAEAALTAGTIDVYANSFTTLSPALLALYGGVITDISQITSDGTPLSQYRGYLFNTSCCRLMYQFEAALNQLIANGTYADILQKQREDPRQPTFDGGYFNTPNNPAGILVEPLPFNSSMAGTIPQGLASTFTGITGCRSARFGDPLVPPTDCISQFVLFNTPICFGFSGESGATGIVGFQTGCFAGPL